jgi:hypothetical protein
MMRLNEHFPDTRDLRTIPRALSPRFDRSNFVGLFPNPTASPIQAIARESAGFPDPFPLGMVVNEL